MSLLDDPILGPVLRGLANRALLETLAKLPDSAKLATALALIKMLPLPDDDCPICGTPCAAHTLAVAYRQWAPHAPDAHPPRRTPRRRAKLKSRR